MKEVKINLKNAKNFHRASDIHRRPDRFVAEGRLKKQSKSGAVAKLFLIAIVFGGGWAGGYYFQPSKEVKVEVAKKEGCETQEELLKNEVVKNNEYRSGVVNRSEILRDYVNFIFLPKEEIENPEEYAAAMEEKILKTEDEALLQKFYATGDGTEKEKGVKMLEFINETVESIKRMSQ